MRYWEEFKGLYLTYFQIMSSSLNLKYNGMIGVLLILYVLINVILIPIHVYVRMKKVDDQ